MRMKRWTALLLSVMLFVEFLGTGNAVAAAGEPDLKAPSAILMEESNGQVIYERAADESSRRQV